MKNIFLGILALSLVATTAFADNGVKKVKKAKTECTKGCRDSKDCHKNAKCPSSSGCTCS